MITVACPKCRFAREVEQGLVPAGKVWYRCRSCGEVFVFDKDEALKNRPQQAARGASPRFGKKSKKIAETIPQDSKISRPTAVATPRKTKKPAGFIKKLFCAVLVVLLITCAAALPWAAYHKAFPTIAQRFLIACMFSGIGPVQKAAIQKLRQYPSKETAVALIVFANLKNLRQADDPKNPPSPEEKQKREQKHLQGLAIAERAVETLCLLSDESFGTYYKKEQYGYSWGSLSQDQWPSVLWQINGWAVQTLGGIDLPAIFFPQGMPALQIDGGEGGQP